MLRKVQDNFEYLLFLFLQAIAHRLSFRLVGVFGAVLGSATFTLTGFRKQVTLENLTRAFPELRMEEILHIARGAYRNYGISILEMLWAGGQPAGELLRTVRLVNPGLFHAAASRGKGVILLSAHYGGWELLASAFRLHLEHPLVIIVQHQRNQKIDALLDANRTRFGNSTVPMGPSVREIIQALQHGKTTILLGDQSGPKESVFINFFGRPAATHKGAAAFSLKTGAPIVMTFLVRQHDGTYNAFFEEVDQSGMDKYTEENIVELTKRHATILEKYVRKHPDHWLWMHKRWKHTDYYHTLHPAPFNPSTPLRGPVQRVSTDLPIHKVPPVLGRGRYLMSSPLKILVFHTAFIGDIILALPLVQVLRNSYQNAQITFVAIPSVSSVLHNHPAVREVLVYDKKGRDGGIGGILSLAKALRARHFDLALIPHRSLRSAVIAWLARIPRRVGFSTSAGRFLLTDVVAYDKHAHEIARNIKLLEAIGIRVRDNELPNLYPAESDCAVVDGLLKGRGSPDLVALAPGSVWNTKRWLKENYIALGKMLVEEGVHVVLVGGKEDEFLCREIEERIGSSNMLNAAGKCSLLQSAELIRRCKVAVSNDSAPMHMAVAMRTPVVAIFGATVPEFGFAPKGKRDVVVETVGLPCRPCSIHGGEVCPIKTFVCMKNITPQMVYEKVMSILSYIKSEV